LYLVILVKKALLLVIAGLLFIGGTAIIIKMRSEKSAKAVMLMSATVEPILIIDPGHGGLDGGAVAADGSIESEFNLDVALKMREAAHLFGIVPILTRYSEELPYPEDCTTVRAKKIWDQKQRVSLVNDTENAVLISVHQNMHTSHKSCGIEVLYANTPDSDIFGKLTQNNLTTQLDPDNHRVAAPIPDTIYLMNRIQCPAILVECGFLSNESELKQLKSDFYRTELALALLVSYLQYIS